VLRQFERPVFLKDLTGQLGMVEIGLFVGRWDVGNYAVSVCHFLSYILVNAASNVVMSSLPICIMARITRPAALAEAKELNINMSRAAENGVKVAVLEAKSKLWIEENFDAIESSNAHVEKHGLPLDKYRCF